MAVEDGPYDFTHLVQCCYIFPGVFGYFLSLSKWNGASICNQTELRCATWAIHYFWDLSMASKGPHPTLNVHQTLSVTGRLGSSLRWDVTPSFSSSTGKVINRILEQEKAMELGWWEVLHSSHSKWSHEQTMKGVSGLWRRWHLRIQKQDLNLV